ncbi:alpha/beta hydrolase [Streptomyces sp. WAC 06738]|uniref:alpha/beta hydrolase family protein n=1 Tax=Streptomyces sp. WAC 06738 TaxID=2203210 RepID=UPI000F6F8DBF|nr:alpha/beta hydrolase [Streptomyces sp. WAC 06738]AZM48281.1 alpha/beta hydrolase [Streptomyces sp. WAC 06738]
MPQEISASRPARLGRATGAASAQAVALLLPAGEGVSSRRPSRLAAASVWSLARRLGRAGRGDGLVAHTVHYRYRGWNGAAADAAQDSEWALEEIVRRYGDVPVALVGTDVGGRAALRAAGHEAVVSVLAIAPWLPDAQAADAEPVRQLSGRTVLLVHGTDDARTDPDLSYRLAVRAKKANRDVCRFEVHSDGHGLHQHRPEVLALSADFVMGSLFGRPYSRPLADALAAPPPIGLRMPLAAGFAPA